MLRSRDSTLNLAGAIRIDIGGTIYIASQPTTPPGQAKRVLAFTTAYYEGFSVTGEGNMAYQLPDDKQLPLSIAYVDKNGNPASIDGAVKWASSDESVLTVAPGGGPQSLTAVVTPVQGQGLGTAQVQAVADADMGSGTTEII